MTDSLVHRLETVVGADHVLVDADELAGHVTDWTGRWQGDARCVVRPGSAAEVATAVRACAEAGVHLVVQGGNTGLVGGAVPTDRAVLLSTRRLDTVGPVDERTGHVEVGAGATLTSVAAAADDAGWAVGVDLASRDTATIGGMVATDAGGARVVAHGPMRDHVLGLEVVLADGTVARPWMEGLAKDTAGYDLRQLLVGSEGTLGVITRVLLQLVRPTPTTATVLLGTSAEQLAAVVAAARQRVAASTARLTACEFVTAESASLVAEVLDVHNPVTTPVALLVDLAGEVTHGLLRELDDLGTTESVVGLDAPTRQRLWELRERHTEAVATLGVPVKLDVALPLDRLAEFLARARATVTSILPSAPCVLFGHAAEGNVHVNVGDAADHADALEDAVYAVVAECGGTISAEHGIGRAKVAHLGRTRDPGTIAGMHRLKHALDPDLLLNPGAVLPVDGGA